MSQSPSRMRWLIVMLLFFVYVLMFIDRVNISVAATYIMQEFDLSNVQMGAIFSAFVFGYALFQIPGGWLGDRFGPRRVLTIAIVWWSAFTAATAIAGSTILTSALGVVGAFATVRFLIGVGEALGPPNGARVIANWIPPRERGLALGTIFAGNTIGAAVAPPLVVWIMVTWGWREAFYLAGSAGLLVALIWYLIATDRPADHARVNAAELRHISAIDAAGNTAGIAPDPIHWSKLLRRKELWCVTAAYFSVGYILYLYFAWFYLYLINARGMSIQAAGIYTMAPFVVSAVCAPFGGALTDYLSRRYGHRIGRNGLGISGLILTAVFITGGATVSNSFVAVALLSLGAGAVYASMAAYWAAIIDIRNEHAGFASGFMNMGCNLGGVLSPILTPLLAEKFGWNSALYVAAAIALMGSLFWFAAIPAAERIKRLASPSRREVNV